MKCPSCDGRKKRKDNIYSASDMEPVTTLESICTRCDENGNIPDPEPTLQECLETLKVIDRTMAVDNGDLREKVIARLEKLFS
jgi:hypothetical protein